MALKRAVFCLVLERLISTNNKSATNLQILNLLKVNWCVDWLFCFICCCASKW